MNNTYIVLGTKGGTGKTIFATMVLPVLSSDITQESVGKTSISNKKKLFEDLEMKDSK